MIAPREQRGAIGIMLALMLLGLITMLGLVEVGYLYWAHRDVQKVADLAALSGAQRLNTCNKDGTKNTAAYENATQGNHFSGQPAITCGYWSPSISGAEHFIASASTSAQPNAVKVIASRAVTPFFGFTKSLPNVGAVAIATNTNPIAVFSVGTTLVRFDGDSTLGRLLRGVGIPLNGTSLVGYNGLADVYITPAGLLRALGISVDSGITIGDLNSLLAAHRIALGQLLDAAVTAAGHTDFLSANASLLQTILANIKIPQANLEASLPVPLGGQGGLLANIVAPTTQTALQAKINVLQLIATAIGIGTGKHAIGIDQTNVNLGNLINVTVESRVIEPPSLGIGGIGATAYSAQIRTFVHLKVSTVGVPLVGSLLGDLLGTKISLDLPLAIDAVGAKGTLTDLCDPHTKVPPTANIHVDSSVLKMCVGNMTATDAFQTSGSCEEIPGADEPIHVLSVSVAGADLLDLNTHFATDALPASGDANDLQAGDTKTVGNALEIGSTLDNLMKALTLALIANPQATKPNAASAKDLATKLWDSTDTEKSYTSRTQDALQQLADSSSGLHGLLGLGDDVGQISNILGSTLTLNIPGLLEGVSGLLGGLTNTLSGVLNGVTCTVLHSSNGCINLITDTIRNSGSTGGSDSNALLGVLGLVIQTLKGPLNFLGSSILTPLFQNTLGIKLGQTDVHLISLQCKNVQLVY